jgi:hypothetical protein
MTKGLGPDIWGAKLEKDISRIQNSRSFFDIKSHAPKNGK